MTPKIYAIAALSVLLSSCGFGGKNADPLNGQQADSYVTSSAKEKEDKAWKKRFEEETAKSRASIQATEQESQARIQSLQNQYEGIEKSLRQKQAQSESAWQKQQEEFLIQLDDYKTRQDSVIANLQERSREWQQEVQACENRLNNPQQQSFQGLLYKYDFHEATLPRSLEFTVGQRSEYRVNFNLKVGQEGLRGLNIIPADLPLGTANADLPQGITMTLDGDNSWLIKGTPEVEIPLGENHIKRPYTLKPDIDFDQIHDEDAKSHLQREDMEERIMLVIHQTQQPPTIEDFRQNENIFEVVVHDSAVTDSDSAPIVSLAHQLEVGTNNVQYINGAEFMTPFKVTKTKDWEWTYSFKIHPELVPKELAKAIAQVNIKAQSQVSGLPSVTSVAQIHLDLEEIK